MDNLYRQANSSRLIRILQKIPLFAGLYDQEYELLLNVCRVSQYVSGERVFNEGDASNDMYVLLSGEVEISTRLGGTIHHMHPGEILGEVAMVSDMRRTATATACGDIFLLGLSRDDLDGLLARGPRVSYLVMKNIARALAERLAATNHRALGVLELGHPERREAAE